MKILLIEDEKRMADALGEILKAENYDVDRFAGGLDGFEAARTGIYDLIILDVMLPDISGFKIASKLRENHIATPILMLTAKGETDDKVEGLDSGADDYLTKPFMTKELLARIRALLRRTAPEEDGALAFGDIKLNIESLTLSGGKTGSGVRLSEKECKAMEYLMTNSGRVLTREQIALKIWGYDSEAEYNNVEVYMSFLRKKLNHIGAKTSIKAVRGVGYELKEPAVNV